MAGKIPAIIHFIWWQGQQKLPQVLHRWPESWAVAHPDHRIVWWDAHSIGRLIASWPGAEGETLRAQLAAYPTVIQRIDVAKILILKQYGGIYVDCDVACLKNSESLLVGKSFYVCREKQVHFSFCNAVLASAPQHPILRTLLNGLRTIQQEGRAEAAPSPATVLQTTGPTAMTRILLAVPRRPDVTLDMAAEHFYAAPWAPDPQLAKALSLDALKARYPQAYGLHLWAGSWRRAVR